MSKLILLEGQRKKGYRKSEFPKIRQASTSDFEELVGTLASSLTHVMGQLAIPLRYLKGHRLAIEVEKMGDFENAPLLAQ